ncbi:S9 family peptidase [Phenylobacterium sp.]|uniref:S9 family peptidase n=1 Tax=Phenylobacterium sp. TaxID=1871053 RepID=UPI0012032EF6|nr:S9 family peptidase [Phenylobacterium sp.]THD57201.1 MAG: S9 family peptidase [Phenylobacterium sp.]
MKFSTLMAAAAVAVAGFSSVQAAAKVPLTHEALWMMKRVGSPEVSPDGKWVVFSISEPAYDPEKAVSDLWLVSTSGGAAPKRLTNTKAGENGVVWSPDSTRIAFTTKREGDEVEQVYVLDVIGGGEARRVTSLSTAATRPQWRPDGQAILFETMVYPGALDDEANKKAIAAKKARKYNVRTYEHFPIRYWNEWLDERMPTIEVVSLEPGAKPKDILSPTTLAHTPGFSGPEGETSISLSPIWSPDGKEVVFSATVERWNAAFSEVNYQLWRLPVDGGEAAPITPAKGGFRSPTFSADGKSLYFGYAPRTEEIYNLARFSKVAWPAGGEITTVARDFDREPERFQITPDGKTAYILVPEAGKTNLYSVPTAGGKPALVIEPATGGYGALTIPQKAAKPLLIASYGSSVSPEEIVRIDPAAKTHANLTHVDTAEAATFDWQPPQHFWFTSAGGRQIHNMIILPPNFDPAKKYPLLVFIHGGAASMNTDSIGLRWNYHLLTAAGYVMLMTDYTGSTGFGEKFAQQIKLDPLKTPGLEIDQAVNEALKRYPYIDGTKMCALGASYGGHMVNWLEATTTRYKCLVSHAGEVDLESQWGMSDGIYNREVTNGGPPWEGNPIWRDQSPITYAKNWKTPMLLSVGERDFRVPIGNTLENWSTLQRMKVPSRLLVWPDAWHWILKPEDSRHFYQEVDTWLAHYLKDGPAPPAPGAIK